MKRIIVTGAGGAASENFIKSLRMADEDIFIVGTNANKYHLELSRADKKYLMPPVSDISYIDKLNKIVETEKIDLVHPQPDVEVGFLSENREKINAKLYLPSREAVKICQDKFRFNEVMKNNDVPVPNAVHITCEKDIEKCFETLSTDGRKVWIRAVRGAGSRAALPVNNVKHAKMWIDYWISMRGLNYSDFMMSEFLPKKEFAFQSIWKDGQIVMSQARERQEYVFGNLTASGQSSSPSIAKTVHRDDVNKTATDAVLACDKNATGIFCVDLKENLDEIPCVTEINLGRFFTTSNFFSRAGCNMPYNYIKLAFGEVAEKFPKYNALDENIYWIRLMDSGNVMIRNSGWTSKEL